MTFASILMVAALLSFLIGVFNPPVPINMVSLGLFLYIASVLLGSGVIKLH